MKVPVHILIVDDEEIIRDSCQQSLEMLPCETAAVESGLKALELLQNNSYDIIILDLKMPGLDGMAFLKKVMSDFPETVVIVITGYPSVGSAVEAMKNGAYDFLPKPFTPDELRLIVNRAIEKRQLTLKNMYLQRELETNLESNPIIGKSKVIKAIQQRIRKVGPTGSTVLLTGESGTGKEVIARAIHKNSIRERMPFVTVDCSTLVENLFESELFGHVKGSFTGATATKHGRLELANRGTIFFDEIGNIGTAVQAKLLRAIQEREITKVGSTQTIKIDVRIIAATNKDLKQAVLEETFREDLFYRLSVVPMHLPPLRDRKEDIPLLADFFLDKYNSKRRKSIKGISGDAMKTLTEYDWPGNVRELENAIERAVVLTDNEYLLPYDLSYFSLGLRTSGLEMRRLRDVEKEHIAQTLLQMNGHKQKTAEVLGIDRKTLRLKMRRYGIRE